ncbi:hypothetical protein SUGI_0199420 [Cryptomeria japonica]|nr:hypothetical protein SUGI_0199420 [Cryptomeria japonica]
MTPTTKGKSPTGEFTHGASHEEGPTKDTAWGAPPTRAPMDPTRGEAMTSKDIMLGADAIEGDLHARELLQDFDIAS